MRGQSAELSHDMPPVTPTREFFDAAMHQSGNRVISLDAVHQPDFEVSSTQRLAQESNDDLQIKQTLHSIVQAGESLYGIAKAEDSEAGTRRWVVTRLSADPEAERAEIIAILPDKTSAVLASDASSTGKVEASVHGTGRLYLCDLALDSDTRLLIHEPGYETQPVPDNPQATITKQGLFSLFKRKQGDTTPVTPVIPPDPLLDARTWSIDPAVLKEAMTPKSEAFQFIKQHTTGEALKARRQLLRDRVANDPILKQLDDIDQRKHELMKELRAIERGEVARTVSDNDTEYRQLNDRLEDFKLEDLTRYDRIRFEQQKLDPMFSWEWLDNTEPEAQQLLAYLKCAVPVQPEHSMPAPFANHEANDTSAWNVVSKDIVRKYLKEWRYLYYKPRGGDGRAITVVNADNAPFEVPTDFVVRLAGFDSLLGRDTNEMQWKSDFGTGGKGSLDTIMHYAALSTDIPEVASINVYVQPDGRMFCDNDEGDSHRIAAAILRGDKTIKAGRLNFRTTAKNIIDIL